MNIETKEASGDEIIDNTINITIADQCWVERAKNAALLVIHTIFRPLHTYEWLKQYDPLSLRKLAEEGQISKRKTCLGWEIHIRYLQVLLPREKETASMQDIRAYPDLTKINIDNLEYLIGKINQAEHIITPSR